MNKLKLNLLSLYILEAMKICQVLGMQYLSSNYPAWLMIVTALIYSVSFYQVALLIKEDRK